jgi:hypothetical protein
MPLLRVAQNREKEQALVNAGSTQGREFLDQPRKYQGLYRHCAP